MYIFSPKESSKWKKRVIGFTCPGCGKKPTEADFKKKKGRGPKPKGKRRKRVKKKVVNEIPPVVVHPYVKEIDWRTSDPPPPGEYQRPGRVRWQPKPPQPTDRTLEDAVVEAFLSRKRRSRK